MQIVKAFRVVVLAVCLLSLPFEGSETLESASLTDDEQTAIMSMTVASDGVPLG